MVYTKSYSARVSLSALQWFQSAYNGYPVIAQSDATATIYFIAQFCAASIRERHLLNSALSVKYLVIVRALRNASFIRIMKNCNAVTWFWSKPSSLISHRFETKRYLHGTSKPFPHFIPMSSHDDRPPCLKKCQTFLNSMHSCTYRVYSFYIAIRDTRFVHLRMCFSNISRG